jgi:hypothetical protein
LDLEDVDERIRENRDSREGGVMTRGGREVEMIGRRREKKEESDISYVYRYKENKNNLLASHQPSAFHPHPSPNPHYNTQTPKSSRN